MPEVPHRERTIALVFTILSTLFWGFSFISTKIILAEAGPSSLAFYRQIVATIVLLPFVLGSLKRERYISLRRIGWREFGLIALTGLLGIVLTFFFENSGVQLTTATNASLIGSLVPIFALLAEVLFFRLKVTVKLILCVIVSLGGVYLIIANGGRIDLSSASFRGNLLCLAAMLCWVAYTMLNRKLTDQFSSLLLTFLQSVVSLFLFIPFILGEIPSWQVLSTGAFWHLIFLGVCVGALGNVFYIYAVKRLGATVATTFSNLGPVITLLSSALILAERITLLQVAGMVLILGSLFVLGWSGRQKSPGTGGTQNLA